MNSPTIKENFKALLGVEVELENFNIPFGKDLDEHNPELEDFYEYWDVDEDGSLRGMGAREVKFSAPYGPTTARDACWSFGDIVSNHSCHSTSRCSTHVHVGVDNPWLKHRLPSLVVLCTLMEPVLFELVDPRRKESVFCRPSWDRATSAVKPISALLTGNMDMDYFAEVQVKYSAINYRAFMTHRTFEFRMAPAVVTGKDLWHWVCVIAGLVAMIDKVPDKAMLVRPFIMSNYEDLVTNWFIGTGAALDDAALRRARKQAEHISKMMYYWEKV